MDKMMQRLVVAQELVQNLVAALMQPVQPSRAVVQAMLDAASARLKAISALPDPVQPPLVVPSLLPEASP